MTVDAIGERIAFHLVGAGAAGTGSAKALAERAAEPIARRVKRVRFMGKEGKIRSGAMDSGFRTWLRVLW
jgi:malic enzyme